MKNHPLFLIRQATVILKITFVFSGLLFFSGGAHAQTDPSLVWGTYFGGDSITWNNSVVRDSSGNLYITGWTYSMKGIATIGAFKTLGDSVNGDAFLAKFNSSGNLIWGTYYGGKDYDGAIGLAIDKLGNVYISGWTYSPDIATKGAFQTICDTLYGSTFLAKFNTSGNLLFSTYYGTYNEDYGAVIAASDSGDIYIAGQTSSATGMATKGAYQTLGDSLTSDAFLAKFNPSGGLIWGTYYGGSNGQQCWGIATHGQNIYITGTSWSLSGIATSGTYQTKGDSNAGAAFLANFNDTGGLAWATYYGTGNDGFSVAIDISGNIFIAGDVLGYVKGIATSGAYQTSYGGGSADIFLGKFNSSGSKLLWGTYFGGPGQDVSGEGGDLAFDTSGNIYMAGYTSSTSGIATSGAYETSYWGGYRAGFVTKFTTTGNLLWATYYGNIGTAPISHIISDDSDNIFLSGITGNTSGIATSGTYQSLFTGIQDAFLTKFHDQKYYNDAGISSITSPTGSFCAGSIPVKVKLKNFGTDTLKSVKINYSVNGKIQTIYSWKGILGHDSTTIVTLGNYNFTFGTDTIVAWTSSPNGGKDSIPGNDTARVIDTVNPLPTVNAGNSKAICNGDSATIGASAVSGNTYSWVSDPKGFTSSSAVASLAPTVNTTYTLTETITATGCSNSGSVVITVNQLPTVNPGTSKSICYGDSAMIGTSAVSGNSYSWVSDPSGFTSTKAEANPAPTITTTYLLIETITATGCSKSDSVIITVNPLPLAITHSDATICRGDSIRLGAAAIAGHTYSWSGSPAGFSSTKARVTPSPTVTTTYYLSEIDTVTGCSNTGSTVIKVSGKPSNAHFYVDTLSNNYFLFTADDITQSGYSWSFGDGDTAQGYSVTHGYLHDSTYKVTLTVTNNAGCATVYDSIFKVSITGINDIQAAQFHLHIYPNPFSANTNIEYSLPNAGYVQIFVSGINGRQIATLASENQSPGNHIAPFNAAKYNCSHGIYFVKLIIDNQITIRQIVRIE